MTSWKLIEDAPRDGRSVLLWARLKTPPAEKDDIGYPITNWGTRSRKRLGIFRSVNKLVGGNVG
jgi:hypothetical protein